MKILFLTMITLLAPLATHSNSFNPYLDSYYAGICNAMDKLKKDNKNQKLKNEFMYFDINLSRCDEYIKTFKKYSSILTTPLEHVDFEIDSLVLQNHVNTVIADKGNPIRIETPKGVHNKYYNLYKYNGYTLYVDKKNSLIDAFEIDTPDFSTYRGLKVGDSFNDIIAVHLYTFKRDSFITCGPLDLNYRNGVENVTYEIIYSKVEGADIDDDRDAWETKYMTFFLKNDNIIRIFIHQGYGC